MDQPAANRVRRLRRDMRPAAFTMVTWWVVLVGIQVVAFVEEEMLLIVGSLVVLLGVATLTSGMRTGNVAAMGLACISIAVVAGLALFIYLAGFDPREATPWLLIAMILYVVGTARWVWRIWGTRRGALAPWECQSCGYALIGLRGSTCPECGAAFDPEKVRTLTPPALRVSTSTPATR